MFISAHHKISSPGRFWVSAQKNVPFLPENGVKRIVYVFPSVNMIEATCIWEADSIEMLDAYLRNKVFDWSHETYFEINAANAIGIPS